MTKRGKEQEAAAILRAVRDQIATANSLLPRDIEAQQLRGQLVAASNTCATVASGLEDRWI